MCKSLSLVGETVIKIKRHLFYIILYFILAMICLDDIVTWTVIWNVCGFFFYVLHMMAFYGPYLCAPSTDNFVDYVAEYDRMAESYSVINQKLQHSISEQANLEKTIQELKVYIIYVLNIKNKYLLYSYFCWWWLISFVLQADVRRHERENNLAQKEIIDLQKQAMRLVFFFPNLL